jgi:hydrogenase/urease accessory protein HupE
MPEGVTAVSMLVIGILAALDLRIGLAGITVLAALLGAVHGGLNGAAIAAAGREATALLGVAGAVFVVATLVGAAVVAMRRAWMRIAVRVCGSWIAATGLLLLGWTLSGRAG